MKILWLGHSSVRIEIAGQVLLVDPWRTGNPMFPDGRRGEAIAGATHILITHGHGDHTGDALSLAPELGIPVVGVYDLVNWWQTKHGIEGIGFNKGGTVDLGGPRVTMVNATHSSSLDSGSGPIYAGHEIVPALFNEQPTAFLAETGLTTNPVYVQDLAFWLPLAALAGIWLWHRRAWGYLVAGSVLVMWVIEAVSVAVDQWFGHAADPASKVASADIGWGFLALAVVGCIPLVAYFRNLRSR
jgi:hypothetical protein